MRSKRNEDLDYFPSFIPHAFYTSSYCFNSRKTFWEFIQLRQLQMLSVNCNPDIFPARIWFWSILEIVWEFPVEINEQNISQFELQLPLLMSTWAPNLTKQQLWFTLTHSTDTHCRAPSLTHSLLYIILPTFSHFVFFPRFLPTCLFHTISFSSFFLIFLIFHLFCFSLSLSHSPSSFFCLSISFLLCFPPRFYHDLYSY